MSEADTPAKLPRGPGRNLISAAEAAAWRDGYAFLEQARAKSRETMREARREARAMRQQGFKDGRDSGISAATELLISTRQQVQEHFKAAEGELITLALSIVQQVLGEFDPGEVVGRAATQALKAFADSKLVKVTVHPAREDGVRAVLENLRDEDLPESIQVLADPSLEIDDCVVATDVAQINAGVAAQLKAIAVALGKAQDDVEVILDAHPIRQQDESQQAAEPVETVRLARVYVGDEEA